MKKYNLETLSKENQGFLSSHILRDEDIEMVNNILKDVETFHKIHSSPQVGDIVEGAYYNGTHEYSDGIIERVEEDEKTNKITITVCAGGSAYLTDIKPYRMSVSISGGPFFSHDISEFELVSNSEERTMWRFGSSGACANGGVYFKVPVKRWRIPYKWNARHRLVDAIDRRDNMRNIYISLDTMFRLRNFESANEAKRFLDYVGVKYELFDEREGYTNWSLSHNFVEASCGGFWSLDDIPKGARPIKLMSNGSFVDGFFITTEREVVIYRPNPNAKDVYKPMDWKDKIEYCKHNHYM